MTKKKKRIDFLLEYYIASLMLNLSQSIGISCEFEVLIMCFIEVCYLWVAAYVAFGFEFHLGFCHIK